MSLARPYEAVPGRLHRVSASAGVVLAPNPGPMTLDGTNTWILSGPGEGPEHPNYGYHPSAQGRGEWPGPDVVVVDPGPADEDHLQAVAATGTVVLILVTHHHADHTDGIDRLHEITGAPVRAARPEFCRDSGEPLRDGDSVLAAGICLRVLATPGHTSDSVCLRLPHDIPETVLTGDTVLGRGTTMIDHPDGTLADYLASLDRLSHRAGAVGLPAHGDPLPDLRETCLELIRHRLARLEEVRAVVADLGAGASIGAVTDVVYGDVPAGARHAAERSIAAQLAHLQNGAGRS